MSHHPRRWSYWAGFAAIVMLVAPASAPGEEQVAEFLDGLRQRQMHDMAIEYLDRLPRNPLVSSEIKATVSYERGRTLVDQARSLRDVVRRTEVLEDARRSFERFAEKHSQHPLAGAANMELGNVLVERGRTKLELSRRPTQADRSDQLVDEARELFRQAKEVFDAAEEQFAAELKRYSDQPTSDQLESEESRERVRLNLIRARMLAASVLYDLATANPEGSAARETELNAAAKRFGELHDRYRRYTAGLFARMWQARCYQDLGETQRALTYYEELMAQPDEPSAFRVLKRKTLRQMLECWLAEDQREYDRAIERGRTWLEQARGDEAHSVEAFAIRFLTAKALAARSSQSEQTDVQVRRDVNEAVALAGDVAKVPGEYQRAARQLIVQLRNVDEDEPPSTFAEVRERARAEFDRMLVAENKKKIIAATAQGTESASDVNAEINRARREAIRLYRLALGLREAETPLEEVNETRYLLCYLHYRAGANYDAAVLGEFLARNYSKYSKAILSAQIALAGYQNAHSQARAEDRQFDLQRMIALVDHMETHWPEAPETHDAWLVLGKLALRSGSMDEASHYFSRIPSDSPKGAEADLLKGQVLWSNYLRTAGLPDESRPTDDELRQMATEAQLKLKEGVDRSREQHERGGHLPRDLALAELSLAQSYLGDSKIGEAIRLLERKTTGPLALVQSNAPVAAGGNFAVETYKVALRAYVADNQLPKAEQILQALQQRVASTGQGGRGLMQIYLSLGRELKEKVARLQAEGREDELKRVLASFEQFLIEIAKQSDELTSLNWVAESFYQLGEVLSAHHAQSCFDRAAETYTKALSVVDPQDQARVDALKLRLARCNRQKADYQQALTMVSDVLASRPKMLDAQIEAARVYQAWGREKPTYYTRAVVGHKPTGTAGAKVEIWGWTRLAANVERYEKYRSIYHDARYEAAVCYFRRGQQQTDPALKKSDLKRAEQTIIFTARLDPEMGGPDTFDRSDRLLKRIRQAAGHSKPAGLSGVVTEIINMRKTSSSPLRNTSARLPK